MDSADPPDEATSDESGEDDQVRPEPAAAEPRRPDHEIPRPDPPQL